MNQIIIDKILEALSEKKLSPQEIEDLFPKVEVSLFLSYMEANGLIFLNKENQFILPHNENIVYGIIRSHPSGYAFLEPANLESSDFFIEENDLKGAFHNDSVYAIIKKGDKGKSKEAKVIRIAKRGNERVVGTFYENGSTSFVKPDEKRLNLCIIIPNDKRKDVVSGHKVVVNITDYGQGKSNVYGEIESIIGHQNDPGVDILSIILKHNVPIEFPETVMNEIQYVENEVPLEEIGRRKDFRNETIVTIDGEDAKDLDDAIHVKVLSNGNYELGVHIADVSHYVKVDSELDKEAFKRGTSIYLVDRVIPMLPHKLSNGICSLNPKVNRLTLSCIMEFSKNGELVNYEICESVIKTTERMTYRDVNKILLDDDNDIKSKYKEVVSLFYKMQELSSILRKRRFERGAIDFDIKEAKILVTEKGEPCDILFRERFVAEKMIEDFMLAANETIAFHFDKLNLPFVYRIHDYPHSKRMFQFANFITSFGYRLSGNFDSMESKNLQSLLEKIKGKKEENAISRLLLRTMQQAKYSDQNVGHYGLAATHYTHFTSPIRRYPDLIVHRLIRNCLIEGKKPNEVSFISKLGLISEQSSEKERTAVELERDVESYKKAEFMESKVGKEYKGIISSVTKFGFFVELPNTIEGLVHIHSLNNDKYVFDESSLSIYGKKTNKRYTLGDEVQIKVVNVNLEESLIDFEIATKGFNKPTLKTKNFKDGNLKNKNHFQKKSYKKK